MANSLEIKQHIHSVQSTRKITRAMYLISASKAKKAKQQLDSTLPYFNTVRKVMVEILTADPAIESRYIRPEGELKNPLYLVLSGDKGMAGGYGGAILRKVDALLAQEDGKHVKMFVCGLQGYYQMTRKGYDVDKDFRYPVMNPSIYRAREIADILVKKYISGECDEVRVVFTQMKSAISQEPVSFRLLPLRAEDFMQDIDMSQVDTSRYQVIYEPDSETVFDHLVPKYLKGIIYSAFVAAFTSEQNARMVAMDNATGSADDMIERLTLLHNRARQAAITQEITEIVSGIPKD